MVVFILLIILLLDSITFMKGKKFNDHCLSKKQGLAIRGMAMLIIIFHHLAFEVSFMIRNHNIFLYVGYLCTSIFFFYSGYGVLKGLLKKKEYLKTFIKNRFLSILIPFFLVNILYTILNIVLYKNSMTIIDILASFLGVNLINLNEWYVIVALILYVIFYLCFSSFNKKKALFLNFLFIVLYIFFCRYNSYHEYLYNSVLSFSLGQVFACYEKQIMRLLKKYYYILFPILFVLFILIFMLENNIRFILPQQFNNYRVYLFILSSVLGCLLVVLYLLKTQVDGKILNFIGSISYELYLIHNIFVLLFHHYFYIQNTVVYVLLVFCCSIIAAIILKKISKWVLKYINKKGLN